MNRLHFGNRRYLYGSLSSFFTIFTTKDSIYDLVEEPKEFVPQTGFERVMQIFKEVRPGEMSREFISIVQFSSASLLVGIMVGGAKSCHVSYSNFMIEHQHARFISPYEAKRKLVDTMALSFMKNGFKWGVKAGLFTLVFSTCAAVIPAYRDKEGIVEYLVGGAVAGGLARLYLGVKATISGAFVGSLFASLVGIVAFISTTSMSDVRDMQYGWFQWRNKRIEGQKRKGLNRILGHQKSLDMRDLRMRKADTEGYSESESVFVLIPDGDENDSSAAVEDGKQEANDEVKDAASSPLVVAVASETKNTVN